MGPDVHTPLESLLLFQTLHPFTADPPSFGKISDTLKNSELLRESEFFELNRLEPEALENLYLRLLKEEARSEAKVRDLDGQNNEQQDARKHQTSSPLLETVDEALQYNHLLPQLVNRLYFRYRDHAIKSIEDEERKYRSLQKEIRDIGKGDVDGRNQAQGLHSRRDSRGVSSIQTLLRHDDEADKVQRGTISRPTSSHGLQNGIVAEAQTGTLDQPYEPPSHSRNGIAHPSQLASSGVPQQPMSDYKNPPPFLPPPQNFNLGNISGSPNPDMTRRLPPQNQPPNGVVPSPSPRLSQGPFPGPERSSASPLIGGRVLPPPPGMLRSSGSPTGPLDALADMAGQQYRANPPMPSPRALQHPVPQQHMNQLPAPRGYMPADYPYYQNQAPYHPAYQPYGQGPLPAYNHPHGGIPYQGHTPTAAHGSPYGNTQHYQPPVGQYPQHANYNQSPSYYQATPIQASHPRNHVSRFADQHTPLSNASGRQRPPQPSPIVTSASSTKWKDVDIRGSVRPPIGSPVAPSSREISPISENESVSVPETAKSRTQGAQSLKEQQSATNSPSERVRGKPTRGQGRRGRGGRAGSVASSTVADSSRARTRSESVVSQTDELAMDNQAMSTRKIKPEPSIASGHDDDASVASQTADEARKPKRPRRGTIRSPENPEESSKPNAKRKREEAAILPSSPAPDSFSKPGHVLASRNFSRISQTVMNDIIHHKVANLFAKPLTDREAPGYKDLIYRPQDLTSIKKAISNGSKAANAAIEDLTQEGSSSVWIPESPEVVPPRGIVNSAQLEKELMRIFANAIMFNPDVPTRRGFGPAFRTRQHTAELDHAYDDDREESEEVIKGKKDVSVVKDTREMFETVEKSVSEWRNAERAAEDGGKGSGAKLQKGEEDAEDEETDELAGEEVVGSVEVDEGDKRAKRRRR